MLLADWVSFLPFQQWLITKQLRESSDIWNNSLLMASSSLLRTSDLMLTGFADSDWGLVLTLDAPFQDIACSLALPWCHGKAKSWQQWLDFHPRAGAKYTSLAQAKCEAQWLVYLLKDFHISLPKPCAIYYDNQSALHIVANLMFHGRTKHIEINCPVVRDKVQSGLIHLLPISTTN